MKIILGGGLGGLSAAHYVLKKYPREQITLLEASNRLGGWIKSTKTPNGSLQEQGPRTIRPRGKTARTTLELIEELDLVDKVVWIPLKHTAALNRMIYVNGQLHSLPSSIFGLLKTQSPFSKPLISYIFNDIFAKKINKDDESIYEFVERRFGKEIAEYAISSMVCGICAGDAKKISVKFLMEQAFENEQKHGSVVKGYLQNAFIKKPKDLNSQTITQFIQRSKGWSVYSLEGGLETLPLTLERSLRERRANIVLNNSCKNIYFEKNSVNITTNKNEELFCDKLISSLPAKILSNLIQDQHPTLSNLLSSIPFVTVAVVNLEYPGKLLKKDGFGFLVPPCENRPILGVIYDSCCFPNGDRTILTAMLGGAWFEKYFAGNIPEDALLETAKAQIQDILGISSKPTCHKVHLLRDCIPQYIIGHSKTVKDIQNYIKDKNIPLFLCGSSYCGVGVNDVIDSAKKAVNML